MITEKTFRAAHRGSPVTPRKARYVADLIRGKPVGEALDLLKYCPRRAAPLYSKVVMSALANAQQDQGTDHTRLHVIDARADDGPTMKRFKTRSRGQMFPLLIRYSHLWVVLAERDAKERRQRAGGADRSRRARVAASRARQEKSGGKSAETSADASAEKENG